MFLMISSQTYRQLLLFKNNFIARVYSVHHLDVKTIQKNDSIQFISSPNAPKYNPIKL